MLPLVAFPEVVEHYAPHFAAVFSDEALIQFKRYLSGLLVSENKTVDGINRLFVHESRHQSSLNRLLTATPLALDELNQARLAVLQAVPGTQVKPKGVLSLDDTLLTHYGQHFEQIAYLYDSSQQRWGWAHNLVTLHYSDELTDYPLAFELWQPADLARIEHGLGAAGITLKASKQALKESAPKKWRQYLLGVWRRHQSNPQVAALYDSKLRIARRLVEQWGAQHPAQTLPVTFDCWYTQPAFCHDLDGLGVPYVGPLAEDAQVVCPHGQEALADFAARLKQEQRAALTAGHKPLFRPLTIPFKGTRERYYSYCQTHRIKNFGKVRLVINHRQADLSDKPSYYITNRLHWQAEGITRIRRHRWPVEVYHEEGKAEGLDQYQLRDFEAITRHVALVAVVYSLLRAAQQDKILQQTLQRELKLELDGSVPFWRRVSQAHSLWSLALFVSTGLAQGHSLQQVMAPLLHTICSR
ncbi:MAG: transposase [Candidatus Binatia bacterium]